MSDQLITQEEHQRVVEQLERLQEDYKTLEENFDSMSEGYQQSLLLYDTLEETYHELEETNRELEKARARAEESSRMKTDFIQQISHEIRTPLNILSGFTQILTTPGMELDEATRQEVTQGITDNTNRITSLVKKMLELADASSKAEIARTDNVPAVQVAAQAADASRITLATHLDFDLQLEGGSDMAMLQTHLEQATRALALLLDNAQKFTRPAEAALATTTALKRGNVVLRMTISGQQLCFQVEDNGIGVPREEAEHIFEEFVQLDEYYDGTGIGLTVARSIARRLGGDVVLDTTYGTAAGQESGGARFIFTLPL